ncbi:MAG TPA: M28 family peptidase [Burkholderiales bacterium]|nr:M28 family peptidase [Burkholderiales bacterium]
MNDQLRRIIDAVSGDDALWSDFNALCDCGGRRAGTESETKSLDLAQQRLAAIGRQVRSEPVAYAGWRLHHASLLLEDGTSLSCNPLLGSQSTAAAGVTGEIWDVGRGAPEDFERHAGDIRGCFVLVRHEYPFSPQHVHRRRKLGYAMERGAAGFIIANPNPASGPVSGSSGRGGQAGIPAVGTDFEAAERLSHLSGTRARVCLNVQAEDYTADTRVLTLDLPGSGPGWVVLSAHLDGHDLAESAMDNATGVAAAFAIARAMAPQMATAERGLRVSLFSAEEWALAGSKQYLASLPAHERDAIALNVNLDTVAGDDRLTALTTDFERLDAWMRRVSEEAKLGVGTYLPTMSNSDHYNFAQHGIPALRLVAGFDNPASNIRYILTRGDTRDKVREADLVAAARTAAMLVWRALIASEAELAALR